MDREWYTKFLFYNANRDNKENTPMKQTRFVKVLMIAFTFTFVSLLVGTAYAAFNDELFEPQSYYSYSGPKDGTFTLTYVGRGCPYNGDPNDYRFRINVNRSYPGNDWKFYSNSSRYQRTPTNRIFKGYQLNTTSPYVCIGFKEFQWLLYPFTYWTVSGVQQNVYTWRR